MIRVNPASRAFLMAAGLVMATVSIAQAAAPTAAPAPEEAPAPEPPPAPEPEPVVEDPFKPTIYFGPTFGYADHDEGDFGWTFHALMRPIEYLGIQIEYVSLGDNQGPSGGNLDGVYFGLAPMYRINRFDIFGQVGLAVSDAGDDVAAGGGVMYRLPFEWFDKINVDLELMLNYKYFNLGDGAHLIGFGMLVGIHK